MPHTKRVRSLTTQLRFRHVLSGCLLRSHNVILPQWAFKQSEVVCQKEPDEYSHFNMWNVEKHVNPRRESSATNHVMFLLSVFTLQTKR